MTREERLHELDPVVQEQRDTITRRHAARRKHRGQARGAIVKFRVRPDVITEHQRVPVRMGPAGTSGELRQHQPARLLKCGLHAPGSVRPPARSPAARRPRPACGR